MSKFEFAAHDQQLEKLAPPPEYSADVQVTLRPITVNQSARYTRHVRQVVVAALRILSSPVMTNSAQSIDMVIRPGAHSSAIRNTQSCDLESDVEGLTSTLGGLQCSVNPWSRRIHPEGAVYYVNAMLSIVTDSDLRVRHIFDKITKGTKSFDQLVSGYSEKLPQSTELFLTIEDSSDHDCGYYLVDHDTQVEFWLKEVDAAQMGIQQINSVSHLSEQ